MKERVGLRDGKRCREREREAGSWHRKGSEAEGLKSKGTHANEVAPTVLVSCFWLFKLSPFRTHIPAPFPSIRTNMYLFLTVWLLSFQEPFLCHISDHTYLYLVLLSWILKPQFVYEHIRNISGEKSWIIWLQSVHHSEYGLWNTHIIWLRLDSIEPARASEWMWKRERERDGTWRGGEWGGGDKLSECVIVTERMRR